MPSSQRENLALWLLLAVAVAVPWLWREAQLRRAAEWRAAHVSAFVLHARTSSLDAPDNALLFSADETTQAAPFQGDVPPSVVLVGFDGMAWEILIPLIRKDDMPNLAALAYRGAVGTLSTLQPTISPALWTSIATGVHPKRHGILNFQKIVNGQRTRDIYTSRDRRVRALWNALSEHGKRCFLVNYYNTYPAEPIEGMVVSNFLRHAQMLNWFHPASVSLDTLSRDAMVRPTKDLERVLAFRPSKTEVETTLETLIGPSKDWNSHEKHDNDYMRFFLEADMLTERASLAFYPEVRPDFSAIFFQGADVAQHYYYLHHWETHMGDEATRSHLRVRDIRAYEQHLQNIPRYGGAIREYYQRLDSWLGEFLAIVGPQAIVMVVSDHGVDPKPRLGRRTGGHQMAPPGIIVMAGPGVRSGTRLEGATIYDIAPTIMAAMGMPVAQDLDGRVLTEAFEDAFWEQFPITHVDTYETSPRALPDEIFIPSEAMEKYEKELKSLGYIR